MVCPTSEMSSVIYQLKCQCKADYVWRINLWLETRIGHHVTASIRQGVASGCNRLTQSVCESTIWLHLINIPGCSSEFIDGVFRVLHKSRTVKYLVFLEGCLHHALVIVNFFVLSLSWVGYEEFFFVLCTLGAYSHRFVNFCYIVIHLFYLWLLIYQPCEHLLVTPFW